MAGRKSSSPVPRLATVSPQKGIELIQAQIQKGRSLLGSRPMSTDDYRSWRHVTENVIERAFGEQSPSCYAFLNAEDFPQVIVGPFDSEGHYVQTLERQLKILDGLVEILSMDMGTAPEAAPGLHAAAPRSGIFLVHGHDEKPLQETARFLERLRQKVVVLREQPSGGRTIIEKFESYSDVAFAVVLLTPDDRGGPANVAYEEQKLRPRQNVMFELGYFIGKLGRQRVCALYSPGVEIPSDYDGVVYTEIDTKGAWRYGLAGELKQAGLDVDLNLVV